MIERIKSNISKITIIYICIFFVVMGMYCGINGSVVVGEWDDYSVPASSIISEGNFSFTDSDISSFKEIFPEWSSRVEEISLSGLYTRNGGEMAWYFPTYSAVCIPMILFLLFLGLPASYAFTFTNLAVLMLLLLGVFYRLKVGGVCKFALIVLLSLNPIIFYLAWPSAEVFIYAVLGLGMIAWYNKSYKWAAFFVSVAGMLNPTIMSVGIIMIVEYFVMLWKQRQVNEGPVHLLFRKFKEVIKYGLCYVIGLIPMIYNLYNTGHINLTAAYPEFTRAPESVLLRFMAYIFDLNYGFLPYYFFVMVAAFFLFFIAMWKKHWRFLEWILAFVLNIFLYSFMVHINSGMSGIARYNAWCSVILIFAVCIFLKELVTKEFTRKIFKVALVLNAVLLAIIVYCYGPTMANRTSPLDWTPIARFVLDRYPSMYNPLGSTIYSRNMHVYGGYTYNTPLVYCADDGYVRKILATSADREYLKANYVSMAEDRDWFVQQLEKLGEKESYITVPAKYQVVKCNRYEMGTSLRFKKDEFNASDYVMRGLSTPEEWGTWTEGNTFALCYYVDTETELLHGKINCGVFNSEQEITIYVNNEVVYEGVADGQTIEFDFENPGKYEIIEFQVVIPNAISPKQIGVSEDSRILGLALHEIVFYE